MFANNEQHILEEALKIFKNPPPVRLENSCLVVDAFTIEQIGVDRPSIGRVVKVPGYKLSVAEYRPGRNSMEPDDVDVGDLEESTSFFVIVYELVKCLSYHFADTVLEQIALDELAKEHEESVAS